MEELWSALSELSSLQCRVRTRLSSPLMRRQAEILKWINELPPCDLSSLLTVDMNSSELTGIWEVIQFLLISEPKAFEKICFLRWRVSQGKVRIELTAASSESLHRRDEYDLLNQIRVVWEGTKLVDVRFTNHCLVELILRLSDGQCLTRAPDKEGLYGLMWLRCKSFFSLAQLFAGLLELHVWKCWKLRNSKNFVSLTETQLQIDRKRQGLSTVISNPPHNRSKPLQALESTGCGILRSLVTEGTNHAKKVGGSEVFPLYLQIMKQRILRSWYDPIRETFPYPGPYRNLWVLCHLISIPCTGLCKFETRSLSILPDSGIEMVESLVSIPLLHSFSFYHEFKSSLCEKLLSDQAAALLLDEETQSHSLKPSHRPSKKKKRKTRKSKPASTPISRSTNSEARSPSPTFVCMAAREVTPNLVRSTQTLTLCIQILESIIEGVLDLLDLDLQTPLNFKESPLRSEEVAKDSNQSDFQDMSRNIENRRGIYSQYGDIVEGESLEIPWIFEDWGYDGPGLFEDVEESTMTSWIRNHLPHGIVDGSFDGNIATTESRPQEDSKNEKIVAAPVFESKDSKFESSSLPTSPRIRDFELDESLRLAYSGRNERARSFTESPRAILTDSTRPAVKESTPSMNDPSFSLSGRRRSDSLDPSHNRPPIQIFSSPPTRVPHTLDTSLGDFSQRSLNHDDDDCSCDDTFQDTDSGLSFGMWSQDDVHSDKFLLNNTSPVLRALSCSLLRSHADSIVLRNIVALQKSLIMQSRSQLMIAPITTSNGMYFPLSYYPGNHLSGYSSNNMDFRNQARELEVPNFFLHSLTFLTLGDE